MSERPADFRSDTVTRPTPAMREAIARADVGDDVLGDDPTVIALQERVARIMNKPAAVFVPSGTMANQLAIRVHTEPGDEVITHEDGHIIHYETGAPAALSGVMVRSLRGERGFFDASDVEGAIRPAESHNARSRLVIVENTHNRGGGSVWGMDRIERVGRAARARGLRLHLDGARIWNASVKTGLPPSAYAAHFDTVSCCFSKGLGAPVGSALAGEVEDIRRAHRFRKMFGGSMRQAGVLAAAALFALDHHVERLVQDHANATRLAERIARVPGLSLPFPVETNMVFFDVDPAIGTAAEFQDRLRARRVWMYATAAQRIRAVCHLDVGPAEIDRAADAIAGVASESSSVGR